MREKGKFVNKNYYGERVHTAKLTAEDVKLIDALLADDAMSMNKIAQKFDVADLLDIPMVHRSGISQPEIQATLWRIGKVRVGPALTDVWVVRGLVFSLEAVFQRLQKTDLSDLGIILTTGNSLSRIITVPRHYRVVPIKAVIDSTQNVARIDMERLTRLVTGTNFTEEKPTQKKHPSINPGVAFKVGSNILEKWGCTAIQKQAIMGIKKGSFNRYQKDLDTVSLSDDQLERISYLTNIHQALRTVFSNPDNVYGFMSMNNNNPYFNGRTPLSIISTGQFGALYEVFKRIDSMRNGQW